MKRGAEEDLDEIIQIGMIKEKLVSCRICYIYKKLWTKTKIF